ncbi:DUF7010 family protein [Bacillus tuaregi]|uniref:DUF7010 family protein n=1 Tax=Bacillus tuaregi TaxID=1816695 RepID=UPI0008F8E331|nr:hypothetical protein [Bacillus tuaregi]
MNLDESKIALSLRGKNGIGFLLSGLIIWIIITVIFLLSIGNYEKSVFMLFSTGLMFPLSVVLSTVIKADWKSKDIPLGSLGFYLNIAQMIYFPILFWAIGKSPADTVMFFAIITGAHFFPYGWLYHAKPFYFMAPFISVFITALGWYLDGESLWLIPMSMVFLLLVLIIWLYFDYKNKRK